MSSQSVSFDLGLVPVLVNREGGKVTLEKGHKRVYKLEEDSSSDKKSCSFTIELGNGGQGAVLLAQEEGSGSLVAVKQSFVTPANWKKAKREIDNLRTLSGHKNIIEMVGQTAEEVRVGQPPLSLMRIWIGMELMAGGDLERYRCRQPNSVLSEPDAQLVLHDGSMGLQHMHDKNIVSRNYFGVAPRAHVCLFSIHSTPLNHSSYVYLSSPPLMNCTHRTDSPTCSSTVTSNLRTCTSCLMAKATSKV